MTKETAQKISEACKQPELEAWLLDERLAYFAMHVAEKTLTESQLVLFSATLDGVMDRAPRRFGNLMAWAAHRETATAAQRAEAFRSAVGGWAES